MDIGGPPEHVLRTSIFNRLDVIHLPTCEEATPTWTLQFDKDFSSFVLDPAQDLLVLWESSPIVRGYDLVSCTVRDWSKMTTNSSIEWVFSYTSCP